MKTLAGVAIGLTVFLVALCWIFIRPSLVVDTIGICPAAQIAVDVSLDELPEADLNIVNPDIFCRFNFSSVKKAARIGNGTTFLDLVGKTNDGVILKTSLSKTNPSFYSMNSFSPKSDRLLIVYGFDGLQLICAMAVAAFISCVAGWVVQYVVGEMTKKKTTKET